MKVIFIYKNIVEKYIHLLTPNHVLDYAKANNIIITDDEAIIIYKFIMNNYNGLLNDNDTIYKLKPIIREDLFNKVLYIYKENKAKYII